MPRLDEISDEEILAYLNAGWRFYRKKVRSGSNEYVYIIMRLGSQSKSMGPYTAERWNRIERLREQIKTDPLEAQEKISRYEARKRFLEARSNIMSRVSIDRGSIMSRTCLHEEDGFCRYWVWPTKMPFFTNFEDVYKENVEYVKSIDESDSNWVVKAQTFYCAGCAAYQRKIRRVPVRLV